jgi:hypothetical protein
VVTLSAFKYFKRISISSPRSGRPFVAFCLMSQQNSICLLYSRRITRSHNIKDTSLIFSNLASTLIISYIDIYDHITLLNHHLGTNAIVVSHLSMIALTLFVILIMAYSASPN